MYINLANLDKREMFSYIEMMTFHFMIPHQKNKSFYVYVSSNDALKNEIKILSFFYDLLDSIKL